MLSPEVRAASFAARSMVGAGHQRLDALVHVAEALFEPHHGLAAGGEAKMTRLDDAGVHRPDRNLMQRFRLRREGNRMGAAPAAARCARRADAARPRSRDRATAGCRARRSARSHRDCGWHAPAGSRVDEAPRPTEIFDPGRQGSRPEFHRPRRRQSPCGRAAPDRHRPTGRAEWRGRRRDRLPRGAMRPASRWARPRTMVLDAPAFDDLGE